MTFQTAYSTRSSAREAAAEIEAGLQTFFPKMVLFFASSNYRPKKPHARWAPRFPAPPSSTVPLPERLSPDKC